MSEGKNKMRKRNSSLCDRSITSKLEQKEKWSHINLALSLPALSNVHPSSDTAIEVTAER